MKVLHIGNIANNAYLNAKILNEQGIKSDVLCYDYYHIMGCPEWEDADFEGDYGNDNTPQWSQLDLKGFKRPEWFVQGPKLIALKYLIAKNEKATCKKFYYKFLLKNERRIIEGKKKNNFEILFFILTKFAVVVSYIMHDLYTLKYKLSLLSRKKRLVILPITLLLILALLPFKIVYFVFRKMTTQCTKDYQIEFNRRILELKQLLAKEYPEKLSIFNESFFVQFQNEYLLWKKLFKFYDVVIGYGIDGFYPMLLNKKYIAFEHGTLRNMPFLNNDIGLSTFLAYTYANGVIITNADNICSAQKLALKNYMFIPHPLNEAPLTLVGSKNFENLYTKYDTDFIAFHPSRQHWEKDVRHPDWEKGNDIFIEGFAKFVKTVNNKAKSIFVEWGQKVNESKQLIHDLGIDANVIWLKPMHNYAMIRVILSCDLVADQFYLGAFGSTTPKALMCSKPAMLFLNESLHGWCFEEMPPVINTVNSQDVYEGLSKLYCDRDYAKDISLKSAQWYHMYHSNEVIKQKISQITTSVVNS